MSNYTIELKGKELEAWKKERFSNNQAIKDSETRINKFHLESEIKFKENKKNINFRLQGGNKYYYANQCAKFTNYVLKNGYPYIDKKEIKENGISFNTYSINVGYNQYCRDLMRFNSKEELLGFVIGYNTAHNI
jgi:hypothetical protein